MKKCLILFCLFMVVGCSSEVKEEYKTISSDEAYEMMQNNQDVYIIDVRTEEEYESAHIENAINIPIDYLEEKFKDEVTDDKDATILVYCASGARSEKASKILFDMGYTNVNNFGGLNSWKYDLVSEV